MRNVRLGLVLLAMPLVLSLSACGTIRGIGKALTAPTKASAATDPTTGFQTPETFRNIDETYLNGKRRSSLRDLLGGGANANTTVEVNKYLWKASLEVLGFLPVESVDPFTGVIVTGYGTPPGGGRAYRATILVQDPALDARSLKIAMQTRGGASVDADTVRAVEDAILTRARQLRIQDRGL